MSNKAITIAINYAGMQLHIVKNDKGEDCTPLKPIVDLFGIRWTDQHKKVTASPHLSRFLGVCMLDIQHAGAQKREETCILLSRVSAFIMTINPDRVRSHGNVTAAEFLEQKLNEWADAIHDYEQLGAAFNMNHAKSIEASGRQSLRIVSMIKAKAAVSDQNDRRLIAKLIENEAGELGITYQPDMLDSAA